MTTGVVSHATPITHAATQADHTGKVKIAKINDAQFKVAINKYATGKVVDGKATVTDKATKKSEQLPTTVKTKNGVTANIAYKIHNGYIVGDVILPENKQITTYSTNWKKCVLGTGGGGGALSGATYVGMTATPIGVGAGTAIGATIGAVGGGLTGAATFCF
ncbi:hypothetical protein [Staphylococcus ratti]|uniref:Pathogenicity island protein n=1 Tax=Staphylococcus ratti TaxID=2892440 RepID=A0ABY3PEV5_9STAP|nr:hypothetical protein [Staphylococcus ratti]UEX90851.1 hypothetical protein LN051_04295 [Staphylococcus ratti]